MLRAGVDTKFINPLLFKAAQQLSQKFTIGLTNIINDGITANEIRKDVDAVKQAKIILSLIEGSSLLAFTHNDQSYIASSMDFIEDTLIPAIRK
jgi:hypothetical protein